MVTPSWHSPHEFLSTQRRQRRILVHVHSVLPWKRISSQHQLPWFGPRGQPIESSELERVWTPLVMQAFSLAGLVHAVRCCRVSGLIECGRSYAAGLIMRRQQSSGKLDYGVGMRRSPRVSSSMVGRAKFGTSFCIGRAAIRVPTFYPAGSGSLRDPYPDPAYCGRNVPRVRPICMAASFSPARGRPLTAPSGPGPAANRPRSTRCRAAPRRPARS